MKRPITLICACCGSRTKGRQWWNRDTGYGLCSCCYDWLKDRGESDKEIEDCYGKVGYHFKVNEKGGGYEERR